MSKSTHKTRGSEMAKFIATLMVEAKDSVLPTAVEILHACKRFYSGVPVAKLQRDHLIRAFCLGAYVGKYADLKHVWAVQITNFETDESRMCFLPERWSKTQSFDALRELVPLARKPKDKSNWALNLDLIASRITRRQRDKLIPKLIALKSSSPLTNAWFKVPDEEVWIG